MADYLKGLVGGMASGTANNAARDKAAAEQAEKDRKFALDIAGESRQFRKVAMDEWAALQASIDDDQWDASMVPALMNRAAMWDKTYSEPLGQSALKHFSEALHVAKTKGGPQRSGKQGPASPAEQYESSLYGMPSETQKLKVETLQREARLANIASTLPLEMGEVWKRASVGKDGTLDPEAAAAAVMDWQAQKIAEHDLSPVEADKIFDTVWDEIAKRNGGMALTPEQKLAQRKFLADTSETLHNWIKGEFANYNELDSVESWQEGTEQIRKAMQIDADKYALAGFDAPAIWAILAQKYAHNGKWRKSWRGADAEVEYGVAIQDLWSAGLSQAPRWFPAAVQRAYNNGANPEEWRPIFDPATGTIGLYNDIIAKQTNDQDGWIPLAPPTTQAGPGIAAPPQPQMSGPGTEGKIPNPAANPTVQPTTPSLGLGKQEPKKKSSDLPSVGSMNGQEFMQAIGSVSPSEAGAMNGQEFLAAIRAAAKRNRGDNQMAGK